MLGSEGHTEDRQLGLPFIGLQAEDSGLGPKENPDHLLMKEMQVSLVTSYHQEYYYHLQLNWIAVVVDVAGLAVHAISFSVCWLPSFHYVSLSSYKVFSIVMIVHARKLLEIHNYLVLHILQMDGLAKDRYDILELMMKVSKHIWQVHRCNDLSSWFLLDLNHLVENQLVLQQSAQDSLVFVKLLYKSFQKHNCCNLTLGHCSGSSLVYLLDLEDVGSMVQLLLDGS